MHVRRTCLNTPGLNKLSHAVTGGPGAKRGSQGRAVHTCPVGSQFTQEEERRGVERGRGREEGSERARQVGRFLQVLWFVTVCRTSGRCGRRRKSWDLVWRTAWVARAVAKGTVQVWGSPENRQSWEASAWPES